LFGASCSAVGLDYLCSITMATKLFTFSNNGNCGKEVGLDFLCTIATKLFTLGDHVNYCEQVV
jgi:hypothetical protein